MKTEVHNGIEFVAVVRESLGDRALITREKYEANPDGYKLWQDGKNDKRRRTKSSRQKVRKKVQNDPTA